MSKGRILVVDDEIYIVHILDFSLGMEGYEVITALDGEQAVERAQAEKPDLIVLDIMMPKLDGYETCKILKGDPATRDIPVILFTAKGRVGERQPWENHEIRGMIAKPYDPMTLGEQVSEILDWDDARWSDAS